jgi:hypothetical protein
MTSLKISIRTILIGVILVSLCVSLAPAAPAQAAPPAPKISWNACYREYGLYECGTVHVPLDYSDPGVGAISLSVIRLPASDPANKIGSIFFNPGGPGGSGVDFVLGAGPYLYTQVHARFDLVGFAHGCTQRAALFGTKAVDEYFTLFFPNHPGGSRPWGR